MLVDYSLQVNVRGLVLIGGRLVGFHAKLGHAAVGAKGEAVAIDIQGLANGVLTVQGGLTKLKVYAAGFILDVNLLVDVSGAVTGCYHALDPNISGDLQRLALIHCLEVLDGCKGGDCRGSRRKVRIRVEMNLL